MRRLVLFLLVIASSSTLRAAEDTRLLSMPAMSEKKIAFVYGEDLWTADRDGKNARRLTSDIGVESYPVFSPDGSMIAFSAQYDGNIDVFTIPVEGGAPTRLTTHPSPDVVRGFTPDGQSILFMSPRHVFTNRHAQLFTVPLTGGMPTQLPIPWGFEACYSPDGKYIAYTPVRDATAQWKHYRGGTHSRIWIYNVATHGVVELPQPKDRCNDLDPNWVGDTLYFRSDRKGEYNLFSVILNGKAPKIEDLKQVTEFKDFPVLDVNSSKDTLIFEQAGYLHILRPGETASTRLKVAINTDAPEARPRFAKGAKYVRDASISPSGARAVLEFRGEVVTVPAEKGDPRNLTNSTSVHERAPSWSPDGNTIAYFSDEGGEYQLVLVTQTGKGVTRKIKLEGGGYYYGSVWSPDSKKLLYIDNSSSLFWMEVETGKITKIASDEYGRLRSIKHSSWSKDNRWVAYSIDTPAKISRVYVYSLEQNKSFPITDGLSDASEPVFDANGKYLYFLSSDSTGMSKHGFSQSASDSRPPRFSVYLAVLQKSLPSPFLKESDEEKTTETKREEEGKEEPKRGPVVRGPRPVPKVNIDLENLDQRILALPVPNGNYGNLQAGAEGQLFMISRPDTLGSRGPGGPGAGATLMKFDIESRRVSTVQTGIGSYELTPDGRKMLYSQGGDWYIGSTGSGGGGGLAQLLGSGSGSGRGSRPSGPPSGAPSEPSEGSGGGSGAKKLNLDAVDVRIEPRAEWKQIFEEAWRVNRDFFYDPNMHGANWVSIKKKYEPFLEHVQNGGDLYKVIRWMLSELAVGHSYTTPGERLYDRKTVSGGLLGADYEVANGRFRFKKIYSGLNFTAELRSPLTAPGVDVKEGEYLLAVKGIDLKAPTELYSLFENTAGKSIELTVGPNPDGKDSRTVTVEPLASELALRNREWIEGNLRKVEKATNGRAGYVYVPDTAGQGVAYFKRYFYPQVDKEALIIDERFNSGGQIADYYIEALTRPFASYWAPRYGAEWRSPSAAVHGPKVMIIDEGAGSGGDMLPYMFRKFKVGPLVGKRTWGGLVGISGYPTLMDGGTVTAPSFAIWTPEEGFTVENEGVAPDHDVDILPKDVIAGKDPQLDKAIQLILEQLEKLPKKEIKRPEYPKRAK
jgi:tricorn protease